MPNTAKHLYRPQSPQLCSQQQGPHASGRLTPPGKQLSVEVTQSVNEAAIQGEVDYADESGFYIGTWASNVSMILMTPTHTNTYIWICRKAEGFSYDIGYLYYSYDSNGYDFGEVYGSVSVGNFTAKLSLLSNTEPDEGPGEDFGLQKQATPLLITSFRWRVARRSSARRISRGRLYVFI